MAHMIPITDFQAPELDIYARLTENQLLNRADPANALFVAESPLVIGRALDAGCVPVSFLMETRHTTGKGAALLERCTADIPVYAAELEVLTQLTGFHLTRGMLCAMRRPPLPTVEAICAKARRIAVLENVMNPTNIGAIFRSAAALGMDAVLLTAAGSDPLYRRSSRVSMGNVFLVPWTYLPEDADWTALLHQYGFKTAAMALRADSIRLNDARLAAEPKLAVVMGTEWELIVVLGGLYGLRLSEIIGLRWRNVDLAENTFGVVEQLPFNTPANTTVISEMAPVKSSERTLPITPLVRPYFERHLEVQKEQKRFAKQSGNLYFDNDLVFAKPNGSPKRRERISANFGQLLRHAEMPHIRFHDLRHTAATNMHQLTGDFYTVGQILGHSLKGIGIQLQLSNNLEAVTAQYVDVRMERKLYVLNIYHEAVLGSSEKT